MFLLKRGVFLYIVAAGGSSGGGGRSYTTSVLRAASSEHLQAQEQLVQNMFALFARSTNVEHVRRQLERGAKINQPNELGYTAIITAADYNRLEVVKCLIDSGADVNQPTPTGYTALIAASYKGNVEMAQLLLRNGAHVDQGYGGETPLVLAVRNRKLAMVEILVDGGASVEAANAEGHTPLEIARELLNRYPNDTVYQRMVQAMEDARPAYTLK